MMIRIKLTPEAREELERTFKTTPDRRLRERCQAVLMADRGRRRGPIAEDLGVHRASVHRWLRAYQAGGLAGLRIRWAAGPPPRIPEDRAATIVTWVKEGLRAGAGELDLCRAGGAPVPRARHRGARDGHAGVLPPPRRPRPYRPTYRYLRGDPARQEAARAELAGLKKSRAR